ncbi:unnamed protein product [Rhizophagus irregularis]|nr:unnamed protein product [Rhizophagus irregularis]
MVEDDDDSYSIKKKKGIKGIIKKELSGFTRSEYMLYIYIFLKKDGGILCYKDEVIYARMGKYFQTSKQSLPIPMMEDLLILAFFLWAFYSLTI